jgi:hypothetical protein
MPRKTPGKSIGGLCHPSAIRHGRAKTHISGTARRQLTAPRGRTVMRDGREILTFHVPNGKTRGQAPFHRQGDVF